MQIRPHRIINRKKTRKIKLGNTFVGGDAPISVQSMTNTLTTNAKETINQITPPIAKSKGPTGYNSGKPAFIKVPTINTAVASHFKLLPVFTFVIYYLDSYLSNTLLITLLTLTK